MRLLVLQLWREFVARLAYGLRVSMCVLLGCWATASWAQTPPILFDNFSACTPGTGTQPATTARGLPPADRIQVMLNLSGTVNCPGWTLQNTVHLAHYVSGTLLPNGAQNALWLNEELGSISQTVTGLTPGHVYKVSADAWTDDVDAPTALGVTLESGGKMVTKSMGMAANAGIQSISEELCAKSTDMKLTLFENGSTTSSPVVTNVKMEDLGTTCILTVTFDSVNGSAVGSQAVSYEEQAMNPTPPIRSGYGFVGWYTSAAYDALYDFSTHVTSDITLYAKWTPNAYYVSGTVQGLAAGNTLDLTNSNADQVTVTVDGRFQFVQSLVGSASYAVTIPAQPPKQICTVTQAQSGSMNNADVSNVLVECKGPYTVTYNALGGSAVASETVGPAVAATRPADPALADAVFGGWFTDPAGTQAYDFATPVNADITLYAKWSNTYTVGGSVTGLAAGQTVLLQNQEGVTLSLTADGSFNFWTRVVNLAAYTVVVSGQPSLQTCVVTQGAGAINSANVTDVLVTCTMNPVVPSVPAAATPVPTVSQLALFLLALGMGALGMRRLRQR